MRPFHLKNYIFRLKMAKMFSTLFYAYLKAHKGLFLILSLILSLYLYLLFFLQPTYVVFPLESVVDTLCGVHQYFTVHMVMKARFKYILYLLTLFYLILSYCSAMAIASFLEKVSYADMLFMKNPGMKKRKISGFFIGVISLFLIVSTVLCLLTAILVAYNSSFSFQVINFVKALLVISLTSSLITFSSVVSCRNTRGVALFYFGYFIAGGLVGKLTGMELLPYHLKYIVFSLPTLHQMLVKAVMGISISRASFVPILVLLLTISSFSAFSFISEFLKHEA